jgi:hypothetical protein
MALIERGTHLAAIAIERNRAAEGLRRNEKELGAIFDGAPLALMTGVPPRRRAALGVTHQRVVEKPFELEALIATVHSMIAAPGS